MNKWVGRLNSGGFTIVELLIVIVVVAILATISVVSFNGITGRAENTKTITAIRQVLTAMEVMHAEVGAYPIAASDSIADRFPCLGEYVNDICASITGVSAGVLGLLMSQINLIHIYESLGQLRNQVREKSISRDILLSVRFLYYQLRRIRMPEINSA